MQGSKNLVSSVSSLGLSHALSHVYPRAPWKLGPAGGKGTQSLSGGAAVPPRRGDGGADP